MLGKVSIYEKDDLESYPQYFYTSGLSILITILFRSYIGCLTLQLIRVTISTNLTILSKQRGVGRVGETTTGFSSYMNTY